MLKSYIHTLMFLLCLTSFCGCFGLSEEEQQQISHEIPVGQVALEEAPLIIFNTKELGTFVVYNNGKILFGEKKKETINIGREIYTATLSENSTLLGVSTRDGLFLYEINQEEKGKFTVQEVNHYTTIKVRMISSAFLDSEEAVLFGGSDSRVYRWKFNKEASLRTPVLERYSGHGTLVSAVAGIPGTPVFLSGDWLGVFSAWLPYDSDRFQGFYDESIFGSRVNDQVDKVRRSFSRKDESVQFLVTDSERVFLGSQGGILEQWKVRGMKMESSAIAHKGGFVSLVLSSRGQVATLGRDGSVKVWNPGDPLSIVSEFPESNFLLITFSSDGRKIIGIDRDDKKTMREILLP